MVLPVINKITVHDEGDCICRASNPDMPGYFCSAGTGTSATGLVSKASIHCDEESSRSPGTVPSTDSCRRCVQAKAEATHASVGHLEERLAELQAYMGPLMTRHAQLTRSMPWHQQQVLPNPFVGHCATMNSVNVNSVTGAPL